MDTKWKWAIGIGATWAGLALATHAAKPSSPVIGPDPETKPKDIPPPAVEPPKPADGKKVPDPTPPNGYLKELSAQAKASVWNIFSFHDYVKTARPDIIRVNSDVLPSGTDSPLNQQIAIRDTAPSTYVLISTDGVLDAMIWFASASDLPALDRDPKNIWSLYLKPNEWASVKAAASAVDPSTIPVDTAVAFAKALAAVMPA